MNCRCCNSFNTYFLHNAGDQPLSLVAMKDTPSKSCELERKPVRLMICHKCGHVTNEEFDHCKEYTGDGCRMYNKGGEWHNHMLDTADSIIDSFDFSLIVEIGAGDCEFLDMINTSAVKVAIDPCDAVERASDLGIHYVKEYFDARTHLPESVGDTLVVMRHLLEHLKHPSDMLEAIAHRASRREGGTSLFIEVPCVEKALRDTRIEDWTYEHPQHFTYSSLIHLVTRCGFSVEWCDVTYDGEVLTMLCHYQPTNLAIIDIINAFAKLPLTLAKTTSELKDMDVAYWGGAGKGATFLNTIGAPPHAIVIDSDPDKWGLFVPGTAIEIRPPAYLIEFPVDTIIATTSWRAKDIMEEILSDDIPCNRMLTFVHGKFEEIPFE